MSPSPHDRRELDFQLFELLDAARLTRLPRFAEHSAETFAAALDCAESIAAERFAPHHALADAEEPRVEHGRVRLPAAVGEALRAYADAGFVAATHDAADGGMQLPFCVAMACWSVFKAANIATETYASLSSGVADVIRHAGSPAQRARYLPALLSGRWFGTMVLTEPQAGSSLADIRSLAVAQPDGSWRITGQKVFITAGDHELGENIVHLVLARTEGAPPGVRGLSLFIVPKRRVDADGRVGEANDVALAGLIHKMGCRGTTSAMLSFGEHGDCRGELIGALHQGLAQMFQMMNAARINVGFNAAMLGLAGYRAALAYARERRQGRLEPTGEPVPLIEHADVRRMLLQQKAWVEGALALAFEAAALVDLQAEGDNPAERREAALLLDLLTPVVKAWPSRYALAANELAIQVLGGYGYTRDFPLEQHYRDNRLNAIHEGTNGIQALDLLGRKLGADEGEAFELLGRRVRVTIEAADAADDPGLRAHGDALRRAWSALENSSRAALALLPREPRRVLAQATPYLEIFGHTLVAWQWLRQALRAAGADGAPAERARFYRAKRAAADHFFAHDLPEAVARHEGLRRFDAALIELDTGGL